MSSTQDRTGGPDRGSERAEPSLTELVRLAIDDAQKFVRAEVELTKADAKQALRLSAIVLVVIIGGSILLSLSVSLLVAAVVLALRGTAVEALLAAAGLHAAVAAAAVTYLVISLRRASGAESPSRHEHPNLNASERGRQAS